MFIRQQSHGFVLPIVVLLLGLFSLTWRYSFNLSEHERRLKQQQTLEAELLFWHRAVAAFMLQHEQHLSHFSELLAFYELEWPEHRLGNGDRVTYSGTAVAPGEFELRIANLPEEVSQVYLEGSSPMFTAEQTGNLVFAVRASEQWAFTNPLIRRSQPAASVMEADIDLAGRDIVGMADLAAEHFGATVGEVSGTGYLTAGQMDVFTTSALNVENATIAGVDLRSLIDTMIALDAQLGPCLIADGPCYN
ncbi:hypothetical protein [Pseudidiomarina homiensis]|uniref:Uncharacterized protein n=1 Tax=Pseudidiomarina homiensis TaxID=364198 RepID=A0A432XST4_9GAMM|nr:hypothetical protein [Pseudidiomarina homiensis]RUO51769.1 hypothetical protein CWI70_12150 [Pseudidiomarina homiensis]